MKVIHIIILLIIVVVIGVIISTVINTGTYADFATARKYPGREFNIIGKLDKSRKINYNANKDANIFTFCMIDKNGDRSIVKYNDSKPQDFEKSEQIVIIGKIKKDTLFASSLLLKCPSKYKSDSVPEVFGNRKFNSK